MVSPRLYCDRRLGGAKRWVLGSEGALPRVPDEVLESVVFLCVDETHHGKKRKVAHGTALLVTVAEPAMLGPSDEHFYLVTAKHNLAAARRLKMAGKTDGLYARVNTKAGGSEWVDLPLGNEWIDAPNPAADVTVLRFPPRAGVEIFAQAFPSEHIIKGASARAHGIGAGDDLFVVGLFTSRAGTERNLPIVRSGILSCMPHEMIPDPYGAYDAYLVEVLSLGGLSGSPVYLYRDSPAWEVGDQPVRRYELHLLGVIRGHWDELLLKNRRKGRVVSPMAAIAYNKDDLAALNKGIAMVTPGDDILAALHTDELVTERHEHMRRSIELASGTLDSAPDATETPTPGSAPAIARPSETPKR